MFLVIGFLEFDRLRVERDKAKIEAQQVRDELKEELSDPYVREAQRKHLDEIGALVEDWYSQIVTPEIWEIGNDFDQYAPLCETKRIFSSLRDHLPLQELWEEYSSWKTKRTEYIDACKKLRASVRELWDTNVAKTTPHFEGLMMEIISGRHKELSFTLFYDADHESTELDHQALTVNYQNVLKGKEYIGKQLKQINHNECKEQLLPLVFQNIVDYWLQSKATLQLKQLMWQIRDSDDRMRRILDKLRLNRDYVHYFCDLCPLKIPVLHREGLNLK